MTEKAPNYSAEATARLHEVYDPTDTEENRKAQIAALAVELGKKEASVRAKLTSEGIYVPLEKAAAKAPVVRKAELVSRIAEAMGEDEDVVGSLENATKVTLERVLKALS